MVPVHYAENKKNAKIGLFLTIFSKTLAIVVLREENWSALAVAMGTEKVSVLLVASEMDDS